MNHQVIKEIILNYERHYPVDQWMINGIHIWPNMRFKLYFYLLHSDDQIKKDVVKTTPQKEQTTFGNKWLNYIKAFFTYRNFILKLNKVDTVFMGLKMHRVSYKNTLLNRFFDPIIMIQPDLNFLHLEIDQMPANVQNKSQSFSLPVLRRGLKFSKIFRGDPVQASKSIAVLPLFENFVDELNNEPWNNGDLDCSKSYWNNWTDKVYRKSIWFKTIFQKANLKHLVIASYYGYEDTAAAIFAAGQLGIPSADFQHGPQTGVHMAYTSWLKTPKLGFNTMPTHYWCWDESSAANINSWHLNGRAVALGNTWLQFNLPKVTYRPSHILYTLQVLNRDNLTYFFTDELFKAITSSKYLWVLRLHPRNVLSVEELKVYLNQFISEDDYRIEYPAQQSLINSIAQSVVHVSNFSGCFLEAHQMGIPNVIIDQAGYDFYSNYIDDELNYFISKTSANFSSELESIVNKDHTTPSKKEISMAAIHDLFNS